MDLYLMGNRDGRRLGLIQAALQGRITNGEGAQALGLSVRQFKRLRSRVRRLGPKGLVHGSRGRTSTRRLPEPTRQRVRELLTGEVKVNDHRGFFPEPAHEINICAYRIFFQAPD